VTKLPVLVKGILRADDALRAVSHGASGIIVSNHGARQLDTTPATILVLPEIVDAVAGAVEVYVDGGIRRGTDVLKAIAYGARAVLVAPNPLGPGGRWRSRGQVRSGDAASGVRSGHGAVRLPQSHRDHQRSCSSRVGFGIAWDFRLMN
jgi:hypothetical protein